MSKTRNFSIEHFYFGAVIQDGQPTGTPGLIGSTPGVTEEQAQECLRLARVTPPAQSLAEMPSALGLFRGEKVDHILLKAQRTSEGFPQLHYWLIPDIAMKWLGGNFSYFEKLGAEEMRSFGAVQRDLPAVIMENPAPLAENEQVEILYDLFLYCGDKIKNVEGLLGSIIHNQPLAIINAPADLKKRLRFIQGLLCLLPAPARVGITWATNVEKVEDTPALIKFMIAGQHPAHHVIYDWQAGELLVEAPHDRYSKFIASQLRLDASLVVENTTSIARTAIWRAMRKDSLAQALYVASRRAAIDSAVQNNQPADRDVIAAILRQDPTLSDELRVAYAQHLLAFTLALDDQPEHADVIPMVAAANRPVAEAVYRQLKNGVDSERPLKVFELIERWITQVPQATAIPWYQVAHMASLKYLDGLVKEGKRIDLLHFLARLLRADKRLEIENVAPQIIAGITVPASQDSSLARAVLFLGLEYLPSGSFQRLMSESGFVRQLPRVLQQAVYHLQPEPRPSPPPGLLAAATAELEQPNFRLLLMGRLAEWALQIQRTNLIDSRALNGILQAVQSPYANRFDDLIQYLAEEFSQSQKLRLLEASALDILPVLYFTTQRYDAGVRLLENYQFNVYTVERLAEFTDTIGKAFLKLNLSAEVLEQIFTLMEHSKLRPEPRTRACCAPLIANNWHPAYRSVAARLTNLLHNDPNLFKIIGVENLHKLLAFHATTKDNARILQTGMVVLEVALNSGERGVDLVSKLWEHLQGSPENALPGLELVRRYVRQVDKDLASRLPDLLEKRLGAGLGEKLQATYLLRVMLGDKGLLELHEAVRLAANLLMDVAITYSEGKEQPPMHRLRHGMDSMSGGLDDSERDMIGSSLEYTARSAYVLGNPRPKERKTSELETNLLNNKTAPRSGWDMLVFLSGYFGEHKPHPIDLDRVAPSQVLGNRSAIILREEAPIIARFLGNLLKAFPPEKPPKISIEALQSELESLWLGLSLYDQRQIKQALAANSHMLAQVVQALSEGVKERIFSNKQLEQGKQLPENGLEALRWISGYFNRTHQR